MTDILLSPEAVAVRVGCSSRTIRRAVAEGRGPAPIKVGKFLRFEAQAVEDWLQACHTQGA